MKLAHTVLMLAVAMLCAGTLPAAASDASNFLEGQPFDAASRPARNAVARDMLVKVHNLINYIPPLPPNETEWMAQEQVEIRKLELAGDLKAAKIRRIEYEISAEVQQHKLRAALLDIQTALACAVAPDKTLRQEMQCWTNASLLLTDHAMFDDAIALLIKTGRIPKAVIGEATDIDAEPLNYGDHYEWYGRSILERIVIPYLGSKSDQRFSGPRHQLRRTSQ